MNIEMRPVWEPCPDCDEFICNLHQKHAFECDCPGVETWIGDLEKLPYEIKIPVMIGEPDEE